MCSENTEQENVTRQGTNRKRQCQSPNELQIDPNTSGGIKELLSERPNNTGVHLSSLDTITPVS